MPVTAVQRELTSCQNKIRINLSFCSYLFSNKDTKQIRMIGLKNKGTKYSEEDLKRTKVIALLFSIMAAGILFGTMLFRGSTDREIFSSDALCQGFIKFTYSQSVLDVFIRSLSWTSLLLIMLFLMGFCCITQIAELLILFWRGVSLGISVSYMYAVYGIKGTLITVLMILPHAVVTSAVLVFAAREALRCSNLYMFHFTGREQCTEQLQFRLYLLRFAVLMGIVLLSSSADCAITYLLTDRLLLKM